MFFTSLDLIWIYQEMLTSLGLHCCYKGNIGHDRVDQGAINAVAEGLGRWVALSRCVSSDKTEEQGI